VKSSDLILFLLAIRQMNKKVILFEKTITFPKTRIRVYWPSQVFGLENNAQRTLSLLLSVLQNKYLMAMCAMRKIIRLETYKTSFGFIF